MKKLLTIFLFAASALAQTNFARMLSGVNAQTGTTYTIQASDVTTVITFNNAAPIAVTLPAGSIAGFGAGTVFSAHNLGTGTVTITCSGCTINGSATLALNSTNGADIYSDGANYVANASASGSSFATLAGGTNTSAAMATGTGSSLVPAGSGQLTSTTNWLNPGGAGLFAPQPAVTVVSSGGTMAGGQSFQVQITISNAVGESLPSQELTQAMNVNGCTTNCSVNLTAPALIAGQTYTVYTSTSGPGTEKKQTASNNCVNITGNCTIGTPGVGAAPPATNTSIPVNPSPIGSTSSCPPLFNVSGYVRDVAGNFEPAMAVDSQANYVGFGKGNLTFCRPVIFNTTGGALDFVPNGALTIFHRPSNTTTTVAAQTQLNELTTDSATYAGQWLGNYTEVDINGSPTLNGGTIFGQVSSGAGRFVNAYSALGGAAGITTGISSTVFREAASTADPTNCGATDCFISNYATAINLRNATSSFRGYTAYLGEATTVGATDAGGHGIVFHALAPSSNGARFGSGNYGLYTEDFGSTAGDWATFHVSNAAATSSRHYFGGPVDLNGGMLGSLGITQLTTPGSLPQVAVTCIATCTASYSYKVVPVDAGGGRGIASTAAGPAGTGATILNGSNFNTISVNVGGQSLPLGSLGIAAWDAYRTASTGNPATLGYIGTFNCVANGGAGCSFVDNGVAISTPTFAEPVTPPTVNDTGSVGGFTYVTKSNCKVNSVSPAACVAAPAGSVVIPTTTTTYTVNTTVVTTNSEIQITWRTDATGLPSAPTCVAPNITTLPVVSARVPFTSFTITMTSTAGQTCFDYNIMN